MRNVGQEKGLTLLSLVITIIVMIILAGIAIPFLGTTLGSAMVFFLKNNIKQLVEKLLLGFASGVMIAASIW